MPIVTIRTGKFTINRRRTLTIVSLLEKGQEIPYWEWHFPAVKIEKEKIDGMTGEFRLIEFSVPEGTLIKIFTTTGDELNSKGKGERKYSVHKASGAIFRVEKGEEISWKAPFFRHEKLYFKGQARQLTAQECELYIPERWRKYYL